MSLIININIGGSVIPLIKSEIATMNKKINGYVDKIKL